MTQDRPEELLSKILGDIYPPPHIREENPRRFVRHWLVRAVREITEQTALNALAERLTLEGRKAIFAAYGETCGSLMLENSVPGVSIHKLGTNHCIVSIESPTPNYAFGDDAAIGTWSVLRGVTEALDIDDLQGVPKRHWFALRS